MITLKILICDDDIDIVNNINKNIITYSEKQNLLFEIDTFTDSEQLTLKNTAYDIAFIDIEVPPIGGLELASILKQNNNNIIIFVITSYECYLDDAMDLGVFRYITKPIDNDRFFRGFDSAIKRYLTNTRVITVDYYDETYTVFTSDMLYITTENHKAVIITKSGKYKTNKRISYWREKLKSINYFSQPHHSYIINMQYVTKFNKTEVVLEFDSHKFILPISQRGYYGFKKDYFNYIGAQL